MSAVTEDKFKKFENEGVTFKAKLIGGELVMEPRGDKMCQNSIQRLKAIIKGQKVHKRRIILKISYSGVKVCDEKTNEILYHHEVPQISFIASDDTDSRTFGYVCDVPNKAHQFICFKTSGPALQVMSEISSLFEAVLEKKKLKKSEPQSGDELKELDCGTGEEENSKSRANLKESETTTAAKETTKTNNDHDEYFSKDFTDLKDLQITGGIGKLDGSPFDVFTDSSGGKISGSGSGGGGGRGSTGAGGDSGIMDLTFNDWLSSPQHDVAATGPTAPLAQYQHKQQHEQQNSSPFDSSPAIPIARPQRSQQLNFTSSSFTGGQFGGHELSRTTPMPTMLDNFQSPISSPLTGPLANNNNNNNTTTTTAVNRLPSAQNRSLIYNHSSVSLNDAALSHRSPVQQATRHESGTDKYAVFNDIDALPSIFESISSLDSTSKLSNAGQQLHPGSQSMDYRQQQQLNQPLAAAYRRQQYSTSANNATSVINATNSTTNRQQFHQSSPSSGMPPRQMSNPFDDDFFA